MLFDRLFVPTLMLAVALVLPSAKADDDAKKVAIGAAVAGLGVAAFMHHKHHHKDNDHKSDAEHEASYERGYNDALYNEHYDTSSRSDAYREGYDAGQAERERRTSHYRNDDDFAERHGAPTVAQKTCVGEASARWGISPRDIYPVKSRKAGGDNYLVEVAAGYRHGNCEVTGSGDVLSLRDGTI
jgi:hypothetical protein